jgi:predicted acylesterase/phospholipase RssA
MNTSQHVTLLAFCAVLCGCSTINSYTNEPLARHADQKAKQNQSMRASTEVSAPRGNERVLVLLAMSGGGSRASYFSASVMLRMQSLFDRDLLKEVDAMSSVSGGSVAAAYYAVSRDPMDRAAGQSWRRVWDEATVKELMKRDYAWRGIGNWLWPTSIVQYWLTAYDRSDLMAQTLADNLYDVGDLGAGLGRDLALGELNPERPYLLINATNATGAASEGDLDEERYRFGNIFTFTKEDFGSLLNSDISTYSVARAVMASMAFPVVFPTMTLRDYRPYAAAHKACAGADAPKSLCERHVHVLDGGNSDNLGLSTIKRVLLEMWRDDRIAKVDRIVVVSIDAFTRPSGTPRNVTDPRDSPLSYVADTNLVPAVDALLRANRSNLLQEFRTRRFGWLERDCDPDQPTLQENLCEGLKSRLKSGPPLDPAPGKDNVLSLEGKLLFYHLGFDDVGGATYASCHPATGKCTSMRLRDRLDRIPTSVSLSDGDAEAIDQAVKEIMTLDNRCLEGFHAIVKSPLTSDVQALQNACIDFEDSRHKRN